MLKTDRLFGGFISIVMYALDQSARTIACADDGYSYFSHEWILFFIWDIFPYNPGQMRIENSMDFCNLFGVMQN